MRQKLVCNSIAVIIGAVSATLICAMMFMQGNFSTHDATSLQSGASIDVTVPVETGIWEEKDWDNTYASYLGDKVPTAEIAVEIACDVLYGIEWGATPETGVPNYVFYDMEEDVWIVSFKSVDPEEPDLEFLGGGWHVAIQKSDGKILRIFADQ